jgi:hypothetical protein
MLNTGFKHRDHKYNIESDARTTRHLTTRHLTARHLTTRHFSTRHPDNSPLWQLATLQLATMTTRHSDNSPPWQLATMAYMHCTAYCTAYYSPDFSFNILQIFGSDQWDLLSHNLFVIFFIRLYRCLLQINYISCPKFCVVFFVD